MRAAVLLLLMLLLLPGLKLHNQLQVKRAGCPLLPMGAGAAAAAAAVASSYHVQHPLGPKQPCQALTQPLLQAAAIATAAVVGVSAAAAGVQIAFKGAAAAGDEICNQHANAVVGIVHGADGPGRAVHRVKGILRQQERKLNR
jgi:hypothetical protein